MIVNMNIVLIVGLSYVNSITSPVLTFGTNISALNARFVGELLPLIFTCMFLSYKTFKIRSPFVLEVPFKI